ncbi:MAG: shikimate dehydrogenase [Bacteroidaceae bacterium]|nr:shikimate dehydrogenase [Bacteroidaceae bacterium]
MTCEYGLLGYPLGHSFSRAFFLEKFAREGIDATYLNFELPSANLLQQVIAEHPGLRGLNVTLPHKQAVIPLLDELSDEARAIGAVNVIRITRQGGCPHLKGFNSDIIGFMDSIRPLLKPHHTRALVLGTGGASKAICHGLEKLGIEWRYVSRTRTPNQPSSPQSPSPLGRPSAPQDTSVGCSAYSPSLPPLTYSDVTPSLLADYTVIVNCTPLGMYPKVDAAPPLPYAALSPRHLLFDLVYNPEVTLFMQQGRRFGATVKSGLEMLHRQAVASWDFWNGKD